MDNNKFNINKDVANLLISASIISERLQVYHVTDLVAFGTMAMVPNTIFHRYLLKEGMKNEEIITATIYLFEKYLEKVVEKDEAFMELKFTTPDGNIKKITISEALYKTIHMAGTIARNNYNRSTITNEFLLEAFGECMTDIYLDFLSTCLGDDAPLPETSLDTVENQEPPFVIPSELAGFLSLMNDSFSPSEQDCRILGRKEETEQLIRILAKSTKKNAILVGPPGVGKTAIVEKFVWSIVTGNCHSKFRKAKVLALDVTSIIAGTMYRGTAEARFQKLIQFLQENPGCILFIDEIHTILGAGACKEGELDLANSMKPILARGETQVIGATTVEEYEKYFSKDGALKRRFEKIFVREPHTSELYEMIKNQIHRLEEFHQTKISKRIIDFAILNASCFNFETKNPDRTLDLIDRAMAGAELKGKKTVQKSDILENFAIRKKQFDCMPIEMKTATAYHEAGHYIVQRFSPELQFMNTLAISIMPAEDYLGVNVYENDEQVTPSTNKEAYVERIANLLGGRRAEKMYTNNLSSGASSDLTKATRIAKDMVTLYGLVEDFTENRVYLRDSQNPMYTDDLINRINIEIDKILDKAMRYADQLLLKHKEELEMLVAELLRKGMLSQIEIEEIFEERKKHAEKPAVVHANLVKIK